MTRLFPRRERIADSQKCLKALVVDTLLCTLALAGCASLPSPGEAGTVSLRTDFPFYGSLAVDVEGNPSTSPGRMAAESAALSGGCGIAFIACAAVMVPVGAAMGAVMTSAETLPRRQARELNRVSAAVLAELDPNAHFDMAMRQEASRRGIVLSRRYANSALNVVVTKFEWDVGAGNGVAIRINAEISGFVGGKRGSRRVTYVSERVRVSEWTADSGRRIRQELMMDNASQKIWQQILDRGLKQGRLPRLRRGSRYSYRPYR